MSLISAPDTAPTNQPVVAVIKLKIDALDEPDILTEAINVLAAESRDLQGLLAAEILVSVDNKTIVILTEWSDHHAWAQSRYDARVGQMIEHSYIKSSSIEFEIYTRRAKFGTSHMAKTAREGRM